MPVLVNRDTGDAVNIAPEQVQNALSTHDVPLMDPDGNHVLAPYEQAADLIKQGYTQPKTEQLQDLLDYTKFGTGTEEAKTAAEHAASAATFGLSTAAETAAGVNPADIRKRTEVNPKSAIAGEVGGFAAGAMAGLGAPALIENLGARAAEAVLARAGSSLVGRIGSTAVRYAAENALLQGSDEASKFFASDPQQSMETAAAHMGLAGLMGLGTGAAFRGAGELWQFGPGKRLGEMLQGIAKKTSGELPQSAETLTKSNLDPFTKEPYVPSGEPITAAEPAQRSNLDPFTKKPYERTQIPESTEVPVSAPPFVPQLSKKIEKFIDMIPETVGAAISTFMGFGPIGGAIVGRVAKTLGSESMEATKTALMKFMGGSGAIDEMGFKAAAMAANAAIKGEKALSDASSSVFGLGSKVIKLPDMGQVGKLDAKLLRMAQNDNSEQPQDSKLQHYVPDHAIATALINGRAVQYLNGLRPGTDPQAPLDKETVPHAAQNSNYQTALKIAQQPLYVMNSIKEGSLTNQEIGHMKNLYPELYKRMQQKLVQDMITAKSKDKTIPYKTRVSLGMFLGQPLETSMTPHAIQANQINSSQPQAPQSKPMSGAKSQKIMKLPNNYETPSQNREMQRVSK